MKRVTVVVEDAHLVDVHLGDSLLGGRIAMLADGDHSDLLEALDLLVQLIQADCCLDKATQKAELAIARARGEV